MQSGYNFYNQSVWEVSDPNGIYLIITTTLKKTPSLKLK